MDFAQIKGQEAAKRAVTVAVAGRHRMILIGPSGHGKSMLVSAAMEIDPNFVAREVTIEPWHTKNGKQADHRMRQLARLNYDIDCEVPALPFRDLFAKQKGTCSEQIRKRVDAARAFNEAVEYRDRTLSAGCQLLMKHAYDELGLTPRAVQRIVEVARTIANMEEAERIDECHLAEAIQYRLFDRR